MKKYPSQNIILIGPMGAGKSSVGKYLAEQLNRRFYDSDEELEKRTGVDIGWIFDLEGEEGFRQREVAVIQDLTALSDIVLATGGGSVISPEVCELLQQSGVIIFLDASLKYQKTRTLNESRRPLLRVPNRNEVIEQLYQERTPLYKKLADYHIFTDYRNVRLVTEDIMKWLEKSCGIQSRSP
jgi:shikimate kinase